MYRGRPPAHRETPSSDRACHHPPHGARRGGGTRRGAARSEPDPPPPSRVLELRAVLGRVGDPRARVPAPARPDGQPTGSPLLAPVHRRRSRRCSPARRASSDCPLRASVPVSLASLGVACPRARRRARRPCCSITFVLVGVGNGLIDVYLNVAAQREETRTRRPVLQWLHASYALGGVTGAAAAGVLRTADIDHRLGSRRPASRCSSTAWWNVAARARRAGRRGATGPSCRSRRSAEARRSGSQRSRCCSASSSRDRWTSGRVSTCGRSSARRRPRPGAAFVAFAGALFIGRLFAAKVLFGLGPRRTIIIAGIGGGIGGTIAVLVARRRPWWSRPPSS